MRGGCDLPNRGVYCTPCVITGHAAVAILGTSIPANCRFVEVITAGLKIQRT